MHLLKIFFFKTANKAIVGHILADVCHFFCDSLNDDDDDQDDDDDDDDDSDDDEMMMMIMMMMMMMMMIVMVMVMVMMMLSPFSTAAIFRQSGKRKECRFLIFKCL